MKEAYFYLIRLPNNDCVRQNTKSRLVAFEKELNKGRPNWNGKQGTIFYLPQGGTTLFTFKKVLANRTIHLIT